MVVDFTPSVELLINFMKEGALTFVLVFSVSYFLLKKIKLFGSDEKSKIHMILALILAIAAITPHFTNTYYGYGETVDVVEIVNNALPSVSLLIVAIVLFLIVIAVFGVDLKLPGGTLLSGLVVIFSLLAIVYIFFTSAGVIVDWNFLYWLDEDLKQIILVLLVMAVVIYFITSEPSDSGDDTVLEKLVKRLTKK